MFEIASLASATGHRAESHHAGWTVGIDMPKLYTDHGYYLLLVLQQNTQTYSSTAHRQYGSMLSWIENDQINAKTFILIYWDGINQFYFCCFESYHKHLQWVCIWKCISFPMWSDDETLQTVQPKVVMFTFGLVAVDGQRRVQMSVVVVYGFVELPLICCAQPSSEWRTIRSSVI